MSDYLPKDVLTDILARLPPKSLVQYTCVCKSWYSLITNPNFISTHLNQTIEFNNNSKNHLLLVRHYDMFEKIVRYALHWDNEDFDEFVEFDCPFNSENEYFRIVGSCNGLICLADDYDSYKDTIILWNPVIRRSVTLPKPQFDCTTRGLCLLGFGFDSIRNDYKVVRIVYQSLENYNYSVPPSVEIYTLSTGTWRSICDAAPNYVIYNSSPSQAFVHGAVHWVASPKDDKSTIGNLIVAFDVGTEVFREIKMPNSVADKYVIKLSVMALGASLALVEYEKIWQSDYCWIWVMEEYGARESWTRLHTIDLREGIRTMVGFTKNNEVLLSARRLGLVSYDPQTKRIKSLGIHGTNRSFYADSYLESLVLLKGVHGVLRWMNSSDAVTNEGEPLLPREEDRVDETGIESIKGSEVSAGRCNKD